MAEKTEAQEIADGQRIERLLADDAVKLELAELDKKYWKDAKEASTDAEALAAVAKARALDELQTKLTAVVHNGKLAEATRKRAGR